MVITRVEALINQPIEIVFGYVSNLENMPDYNSSVLSSRWTGEDKKNSRVKIGLSILNFESDYRVIEYKENLLIRAFCTHSHLEFEDKYDFLSDGNQTRLIITDSMKLKGILALSEGILKNNMKKEMEHNMHKLKNILESISLS